MNKAVYLYFLRTMGRGTGYWFGVFSSIVRAILITIISTLVIASVANHITAGNFEQAKHYTLLYIVLYVAGSILGTGGDLIAIISQNRGYNEARKVFYKKLINKDIAFYRDHQTGYLTSSFRQNLDGLMVLSRILRTQITHLVVATLGPVVVLAVTSWKLGAIAVLLILVQVAYIVWASAKANHYRERSHEVYRKLTGEVSDEITNIVAFKASGMQEQGYKKVLALGDEETHIFWLRHRINKLLELPRDLVTAAGVTIAILVVISLAANNEGSAGTTLMVVLFLFQITRNIGEIPNVMTQLDDLVTQIYPTLAYFKDAEYNKITDPQEPKSLQKVAGGIAFTNVSFSYSSRNDGTVVPVFSQLNLSIAPGERVGIVGLSGAGKSTLVSLLLRFDDVNEGAITIDGTDIRDIRQDELHTHIAYVPQEPLLFHRSIKENILYYQQRTEKQIINAAKAAHAHDFISQLPQGYDTIVGERGVKLSGGQKQRVVIARAILKNAPIMLFDEATSALDSESEHIIQKAMPQIMGKHTAIVIAHRLSTVATLDRILVLKKGQIIEEGSHTALLRKNGEYAQLWQKQLKNIDTPL